VHSISICLDTGRPDLMLVDTSYSSVGCVVPIWREAGCDLTELGGRISGEVIPELSAALDVMRSDPERFRAINPVNGYGIYKGCMDFLGRLVLLFWEYPEATISVSSTSTIFTE
jgi:hypothetical protein